MRIRPRRSARRGTWTAAVAGAAAVALLLTGSGAGADGPPGDAAARGTEPGASATAVPRTEGLRHIPEVGERYRKRIPERSGQVVTVHGAGRDSPRSRVQLWTRQDGTWSLEARWEGHNGRRGWATDHREGDKRTPVGVFTLTDAGGVRPAPPGTELPYTHSAAFTPPAHWADRTAHDFDHVIAVDYNRVPGTSPLDPTRPRGDAKGGFIWLHLDHGTGTSGCVSVSRQAMRQLLRTLDPDRRPVIVMGDRATLRG